MNSGCFNCSCDSALHGCRYIEVQPAQHLHYLQSATALRMGVGRGATGTINGALHWRVGGATTTSNSLCA